MKVPFLFQIKFWSEHFRWGRDSIQNDPKSGRSVEAGIEDLAFIAMETRVSETTVWKGLHDDLGMKKVSARWMPRLLTSEQKLVRK
jgi:hypothetical protein